MKKIFFILIFITSICKSQTINIKDNNGNSIAGAYYQDIDNLLNSYEGTWVFTDGPRTLKIELQKRINQNNGIFSEDFLAGGYEYKVNGVTLVNTLSNLSSSSPYQSKYKIWGNIILQNSNHPLCPECNVGENRLMLSFSEPASHLTGTIIVRKITINGQDAIKINLAGSNSVYYKEGTNIPPDDFVIPSGDYTLLKI